MIMFYMFYIIIVFKDVCIKKKDVGDVIEKYLSILKPLYQKFVLPVLLFIKLFSLKGMLRQLSLIMEEDSLPSIKKDVITYN